MFELLSFKTLTRSRYYRVFKYGVRFLLLLCVMTSQAAQLKDTVVTDLVVETTASAASKIDDSESCTCTLTYQLYIGLANYNIL